MIFLPPMVLDAGRELARRVKTGALSEEEASERYLRLDPCDAASLAMLGAARARAGDRAGAERYFWRGLEAHPASGRFYRLLGELVSRDPGRAALATALRALESRKNGVHEEPDPPEEPPGVTELLGSYRLIDELQQSPGALPRSLVDRIVGAGAKCAPLLKGVLRDWLDRELASDFPAGASLSLLGEIGEAAVVPDLLPFCALNHPVVSGHANWAVARIGSRHPAETMTAFRAEAWRATAAQRFCMAEQLTLMPDPEAAGEALVSLLERLEELPKTERGEVVSAVAQAMLRIHGPAGREIAESVLVPRLPLLTEKTRRACRKIFKADPAGQPQPSAFAGLLQLSIYDLLCG